MRRMTMVRISSATLAGTVAILGVACGVASPNSGFGPASHADSGGGGGSCTTNCDEGGSPDPNLVVTGDAAKPFDGGPEVCDGIDNDGDGIIDNVDVNHDGVCDCLNIATIGDIGQWGMGADIFSTWIAARSTTPVVALGDTPLTDNNLKPIEVLVVLDVSLSGSTKPHHAFSAAEITSLTSWVQKGGGVLTTIGYNADEAAEVVNVNSLLVPLGHTYSTTNFDVDGFIQNWVQHPVTDGVTNVDILNGVQPASTTATTLAWDQKNNIALQVSEVQSGHVIVWGDEWITYDDLWTDSKTQQVERFWLNMLKWLTPANQCQVPIPPGVN